MDLAGARERFAQSVFLSLNAEYADASRLQALLNEHRVALTPREDGKVGTPPHSSLINGGASVHGGSGRHKTAAAGASSRAGLPIEICYRNGRAETTMRLGKQWRVRPCEALLASLGATYGSETVQIRY